jgi:hypothetical protein
VYNWRVAMDADNVVLGSASVVIGQGFNGEKRGYLVSGYGLKAFDEGYSCPGALDPFTPCSGQGVCNFFEISCKLTTA